MVSNQPRPKTAFVFAGGGNARRMRYSASEKLKIIRLVEESTLPVRRTLAKIGIPRATFYRWYDLYQTGGRSRDNFW